MFVQFYVQLTAIMVVAYAIAKKAGKVQNAMYLNMNANHQTVPIMADALMANAIVNLVGEVHFVIKVIIFGNL